MANQMAAMLCHKCPLVPPATICSPQVFAAWRVFGLVAWVAVGASQGGGAGGFLWSGALRDHGSDRIPPNRPGDRAPMGVRIKAH